MCPRFSTPPQPGEPPPPHTHMRSGGECVTLAHKPSIRDSRAQPHPPSTQSVTLASISPLCLTRPRLTHSHTPTEGGGDEVAEAKERLRKARACLTFASVPPPHAPACAQRGIDSGTVAGLTAVAHPMAGHGRGRQHAHGTKSSSLCARVTRNPSVRVPREPCVWLGRHVWVGARRVSREPWCEWCV